MKIKITNVSLRDYDLVVEAVSNALLDINKNTRYSKNSKNVGVLKIVQIEEE